MNKLIFIIPFIIVIAMSCRADAITVMSPLNQTYNTSNVSLQWSANATEIEMTLDDNSPIFIKENRTLEMLLNGEHHLKIRVNESANGTYVMNETNIVFNVYTVSIENWCELGWEILRSHSCMTPNVTYEKVVCIPTKCEEMLADCQTNILPGMREEYTNLRAQCLISQEKINTCKSEPWVNMAYWVVILVLVILIIILYIKDNILV